jgi:glycosyltransferase 2 family protein
MMPSPSHLLLKFPERRPHAVASGFPFDQELAPAACSTNEGKAEKVEGFRFSQPALSASVRREAAKLDQAGLLRMECQRELLQSISHCFPEAPGIFLVYVSRQIDLNQVLSAIPLLDFRWAAFAILVATLEIPLSGLRWYNIVGSLAARDMRATRTAMIAATAVGVFFAQVLPSVVGDGVRAWLLVRLGSSWHNAVTSAVIDRGVGVGLMIALGFVVLLLSSGLTAPGGYRDLVLVVHGALILAGAFGLLLAPKIVLPLTRWRYSRWFATLATDVHRVLFGSKGPVILSIGCLIHAFTIVVVWSVGQAQGLALPVPDVVVLWTIMIGVVLIPISIGGWGLRELAVISLLAIMASRRKERCYFRCALASRWHLARCLER